MNPEVFREYDVRGIVDRDLNPDFVYLLGRAIGTYAMRRNVRRMTLGRDCRLSSEAYHDIAGKGIRAAGVDIIDIGLCATPMLYFSIRHFRADGGVMITGSHNPPDFNGFKICIGPDTIYGDDIQELKRIIESGDFASGHGSARREDITRRYQDYLFSHVDIKEGLKVVLDGGNGVGGFFALPLLRRFGCRVTELYCDPDGRFPNHFPDPTIPENLGELIRLVRDTKADAGIAYDGDADRIGVITDRGDVLWGDELLLLFARYILKRNPGAAIIGEVKCSQKLYDDIAKNNGRPIMWKAGHSLIKGKMKEEKALLAGEMSGHIFFADRYYGFDDAIYASLRLLEI
ncbi:MAG: phosphomannomutase/phosphoglucomutase, partial [Deltaproteobacteria bacterium]|nr:phosphomannomutase/phosphoglucomutase [Deltaproteobacteria bacterium]